MALDDLLNAISKDASERRERETDLVLSVTQARDTNPEDEAHKLRLQQTTGIPAALMDESVRQDAELQQYLTQPALQDLPASSPSTASFLSNQQNAQLAWDDIQNLAQMEGIFKKGPISTLDFASEADKQAARRAKSIGGAFLQGLSSAPDRIWESFAGAGVMVADFVEWSLRPFDDPTGMRKAVADMARESRDYWRRSAEFRAPAHAPGSAESYFQQAGSSVGVSLAAAPYAVAGQGAALGMFALSAGDNYQELIDAGYSVPTSVGLSLSSRAMEGLTEKIGMDKLGAGKGPIIEQAAKFVLGDLAGEEVNTLYSALQDKITIRPEMTMGDVVQQVIDTAIVTSIAGPAQGVSMAGAQRLSETLYEGYLKRQQAQENALFLRALSESAQASKLRQRLPEKMREAVQGYIEEHGAIDTVSVPVEFWQSELERAGLDPRRVAEDVLSDPSSYDEALKTGGEVMIPMADYAARIAPEEIGRLLERDVRLRPGDDTLREAEEVDYGEVVRQILSENPVDESAQQREESARRVFEDVYGQLVEIRGTSTAEREATLAMKRAQTRAERLGMDAWTLYQEMPLRVTSGTEGEGLAQAQVLNKDGGKRGYLRLDNGVIEIGLLKSADLSTLSHEFGHMWLMEMGQDSAREGSPRQIKDDWEKIRTWLGAEGEITTEQHEKFARGVEAYLMEGKAPSQDLQGVFARFAAWMKLIYREIRNLNVSLNKEVREVMDRLLATDEEIARAEAMQELRPLFATAEDAGMSERQFEAYRKTAAEAGEKRRKALQDRIMAEVRREQTGWWKEEKARVRSEVEAEAQRDPVFRAVQILTRGKTFDGQDVPVKLDRAALVERYGEELLDRLPKGSATEYVYALEGGLPVDAAAEVLGFSSGDAMVRQIVEAPKMGRYVTAETDRRMKERHGDLVANIAERQEEALKAAHEELTAQVLREELRAIRRKAREVRGFVGAATAELERERREREYERRWMEAEKKLALAIERGAKDEEIRRLKEESRAARTEERGARRQMLESIPPLEAFRQAARLSIGGREVGMIRPELYARSERKAAREAFEKAAKKDYAGAGEAKRRQLLNFYLYKEAVKAKGDIDKTLKGFKKVFRPDEKLAKGRDMDMVNAARAILGSYGLGPQIENPLSFLMQVKSYNPQLFEDLQMAVDVATQEPKPFKRLTVDELFAVKDAVDNLMHLAQQAKTVEIDGQRVFIQEVAAQLSVGLVKEGIRELGSEYATAGTVERASLKFAGMRASTRRVEHWVDARDGGRMDGPFRRFLWNPVSEAADRYRVQKAEYLARFREMFKPVEASLRSGEIAAPELGASGAKFRSKAELLVALLHTGNRSNMEKLLVGRNWGFVAEDGGLDTSAWDAFIRRMWNEEVLTEADYRFAQSVWDMLEEIKPRAQEIHRKMYGYYFSEISADPVQTPWGTFRGGYVPAVADPFRVPDQALREDREALLNENQTFMFPSASRGFTKSRVKYNKPLSLDMLLVPSHIDKVLKFVHLAAPVRDVAKVVTNAEFREVLDRFDPGAGSDMLTPWLNRAVRQTVETRSAGWGGKLLDDVARGLRKRTGLQLMALNVANTVQQFTGLSISLRKVEAGHLAGAMWHFSRKPFETAKFAAEKSNFMQDRLHGDAFRLMGEIDILLDDSKFKKLQSASQQYGYILQHVAQNMVDVATWLGRYNQGIAEGEQEKDAVRAADAAVRETQGSFAPEDISRFEAGPPFVRLFTQFASYFNMQANLLGTEANTIRRDFGFLRGSGRMFLLYVTAFMIPAVLSEVIMKLAVGRMDEDEDGEYWDDLMAAFFGGQFKTAAAMVPGAGQVVVSAVNRFNSNPMDDRMSVSPAVSAVESVGGTAWAAYKLAVEGEINRTGVRDSLTLIGIATGLPTRALSRPLGYMTAVERGDTDPENALDAARGYITGYAPRR